MPITQVYLWGTEQVSRAPVEILTEHCYELQHEGLESTLKLADKQRDGIFGTAEKMVQCLKSRNTLRWVAPETGSTVATDSRRQFSPRLAQSQETIYILSKEGAGSAAPLTTALTVAIAEAMEEWAERQGDPAVLVPRRRTVGRSEHAQNLVGRDHQGLRRRRRRRRLPPRTLRPDRGLQLHERLRVLWQVRAQPLTPRGQGAHLRRLQPRGLDRGRALVLASGAPATFVRTLP